MLVETNYPAFGVKQPVVGVNLEFHRVGALGRTNRHEHVRRNRLEELDECGPKKVNRLHGIGLRVGTRQEDANRMLIAGRAPQLAGDEGRKDRRSDCAIAHRLASLGEHP